MDDNTCETYEAVVNEQNSWILSHLEALGQAMIGRDVYSTHIYVTIFMIGKLVPSGLQLFAMSATG